MDETRHGRWTRELDSETELGSREPSSPERRERIREEAALVEEFLHEHRRNRSRRGSGDGPPPERHHGETGPRIEFTQRDGPVSESVKIVQTSPDSFRLVSEVPLAPGPSPAPAPAVTPAPQPESPPGAPPPPAKPKKVPHFRALSDKEWLFVANALGGLRDRESERPVRPRSGWRPARGMPPGLFKDVVEERIKYTWANHVLGWIRLVLVFLQLAIGATLTAIGSIRTHEGISVTVLGATNTVIAGLLALMHNSGLPDRYRNDQAEFEALEDHIKELLDSRVAPRNLDCYQIVGQCFDQFQHAKRTVISNLPATYNSTPGRAWVPKTIPKIATPAPPYHHWQHATHEEHEEHEEREREHEEREREHEEREHEREEREEREERGKRFRHAHGRGHQE